MGRAPSVLSIVRLTSARPSGGLPAVPAKMTSSILPPRRLFAPCSPITQLSASTTFDLPDPFGPTTHVMPGSSRSVVADANDLNPRSVRVFRCTWRAPRGAVGVGGRSPAYGSGQAWSVRSPAAGVGAPLRVCEAPGRGAGQGGVRGSPPRTAGVPRGPRRAAHVGAHPGVGRGARRRRVLAAGPGYRGGAPRVRRALGPLGRPGVRQD